MHVPVPPSWYPREQVSAGHARPGPALWYPVEQVRWPRMSRSAVVCIRSSRSRWPCRFPPRRRGIVEQSRWPCRSRPPSWLARLSKLRWPRMSPRHRVPVEQFHFAMHFPVPHLVPSSKLRRPRRGAGTCVPPEFAQRYHDGGAGICMASGTCSTGYHDGARESAWPAGPARPDTTTAERGQCVASGTCSTGYHSGGTDVRASGTCSLGYHDGGTGTCMSPEPARRISRWCGELAWPVELLGWLTTTAQEHVRPAPVVAA